MGLLTVNVGATPLYATTTWMSQHKVVATVILLLLYPVLLGLHNLFFHRLRSYRGPWLFSAYRLPYVVAGNMGYLPLLVKRWHRQYGTVVRIAPDELAYETSTAFKDIDGFRKDRPPLRKDPYMLAPRYPGMKPSISTADNALHAKFRRLLSHAFSLQALEAQEALIQHHVNLFVRLLGEQIRSEQPQDMLAWYTWTTFDIIGDLAFGKPFDCLEKLRSHPWVGIVLDGLAGGLMISSMMRYVPMKIAIFLTPKKLIDKRTAHHEYAKETVAQRMERGPGSRPDFISYFMRHCDDEEDTKGLMVTPEEVQPNAALIALAGGETTSALLTGATYYLLKCPETLAKATAEVRENFSEDKDISFQAVTTKLPYMMAVLDEALRIYPPIPRGLPRLTPAEGMVIDGRYVPGNCRASVFQLAASTSPRNFHKSDEFIPERWLKCSSQDSEFKNDDRAARQPFGLGAFNCIGKNLAYMEMRLILAKVLWHFDLALEDESRNWADQKIYITWDKSPLMVRVKSKPE